MKLSLDQTTDYSHREFFKFIKKADFVPSYVEASQPSVYADLDGLPKTAFADEGNRAFPKNSAANTFLSYMHLLNKKACLVEKYNETYVEQVEKHIKESAEVFGITEDLDKYNECYLKKEAEAYTPKAVFTTKIGDNEIELFPYKTAAEFTVAASQFARDYKNLPFEWRKEAAENFVKIAKELSVDELPDIICKYAGLFYSNSAYLKTELNRRALRHTSKEAQEVYHKMAEIAGDYDDVEDYMKTAEICYAIEKEAGIHDDPKRASLFGDPVDRVFHMPIEKVAEFLNVVKIGEDYFKVDDLMKVDNEVYKQALGIDKVSDVDELRDIMSTVPRSDMQLFRELSGVRSV